MSHLGETHLTLASFPTITMPALYTHSDPKTVKIDFAGARADSHRAPGSGGGAAPPFSATPRGHDGMRDIGAPGEGQRVLLLRHLDQGTYSGEVTRRLAEEISRMIGKGSERDAEAAISRVVMITDRDSSAPWGFAFVELVTPELATALLSYLLSPQHQPNGFLISQVPIAVSFANSSAFIPTPAGPLGGQFLVKSAPNGGIGAGSIASPDGEYCAYWHQQAGAVEAIPRGAPPVPARGSPLEIPAATKTFLGNLAGVVAPKPKAAAPTAIPAGAISQPAAAGPSSQTTDVTPAPLAGSMGPIKIGGFGSFGKKAKKTEEVGLIHISGRNAFGDEEDVDLVGKDTVLLSRSELPPCPPYIPTHTLSQRSKDHPTNIHKSEGKPVLRLLTAPTEDAHAVSHLYLGRDQHLQMEHEAVGAVNPKGTSASKGRVGRQCGGEHSPAQRLCCRLAIQPQRRTGGRRRRVRLHRHIVIRHLWQGRLPPLPAPVQDRRHSPETCGTLRSSQGSHSPLHLNLVGSGQCQN